MPPATDRARLEQAKAVRPLLCLLRKDLAVFRPRYRAAVAFVFLLAALQTVRSDEAFLWTAIMLAGALVVFVPAIEWRLDTDRMLGSLPVRRDTIVVARYVVALLACVIAGVAWTGGGHLLAPIIDPGPAPPAMWDTLAGALTYVGLFSLLTALFLPLYFRLGLGRGALAFFAAGLALYVASRAPAAMTNAPAGEGSLRLRDLLAPPDATVQTAVADLLAQLGAPWTIGVFGAGIGALLALSMWASIHGFRRREL